MESVEKKREGVSKRRKDADTEEGKSEAI